MLILNSGRLGAENGALNSAKEFNIDYLVGNNTIDQCNLVVLFYESCRTGNLDKLDSKCLDTIDYAVRNRKMLLLNPTGPELAYLYKTRFLDRIFVTGAVSNEIYNEAFETMAILFSCCGNEKATNWVMR